MSAGIDTILTAETPEGIGIAIRPAGIAVRVNAFLIDGVIRVAILAVVGMISGLAFHFTAGPTLILVFLVNWLYFLIFELTSAAATPGKRIMGLQVMMSNGLPITPGGALIRNLLRAADVLPAMYGFAFLMMLLRADARRLGDIAGGTVVVYREQGAAPGGFADGVPLQPPNGLSTEQQAAISAFAWRSKGLTPERAEEIAVLATQTPAFKTMGLPLAARLVGIARWLHGQRRQGSANTS